jgi:hypothetical protein
MYFSLEKTKSARSKYNVKTNKKFNWLETVPWSTFGIDSSDGIDHQEIINLQDAVGVDADGLVGLGTLRQMQLVLKRDYNTVWNPCTGEISEGVDLGNVQYVLWKGLEVPLFDMYCPVHTYADPQGIDLHFAGSFSKKERDINAVIVHWGGLNPQHLGRVFANRKASSHLAVGICENTGEIGVFQYLDMAHVAWHAVGANQNTIGIDICQQPEVKHLGYYKKHGYDIQTIENPAKGYGPSKIVSLDPRIQKATASLLINLCEAFGIREDYATLEDGLVSKERLAEGGLFSHFHVDFKQVGKWDVAPWWNAILTEGEAEYV